MSPLFAPIAEMLLFAGIVLAIMVALRAGLDTTLHPDHVGFRWKRWIWAGGQLLTLVFAIVLWRVVAATFHLPIWWPLAVIVPMFITVPIIKMLADPRFGVWRNRS